MRWEVSGRIAEGSSDVTFRICSKKLFAFLRSSHQAFSQCVLLASMRCIHTLVLIQLQLGRNPVYLTPTKKRDIYICIYIYIYISKVMVSGDISTLNGSSLKLVNKFSYLGKNVSSTENDINT